MLLWADSFDHYGGVFANLFLGEWGAYGGSVSPLLSNAHARTGSYALYLSGKVGATAQYIRRSFGSLKTRVGVGFGVYFINLPGANNAYISIQDNSLANLLTLVIQSDGSIVIRQGSISGTIIEISDSVITAGTFHHIEFWTTFDAVAGAIEVRVNGVTVISDGGLNLGSTQAAQVIFVNNDSFQGYFVDDAFAADDTGTENNDFIGPQRVLTEFLAADTAQADWALNGAGTGVGCISDNPPDGDTTYLSSGTVGDKSDFTLPSLPPELAEIVGVYVPVMAKLNSAGIGNLQTSIVSGGVPQAGADNPLTPGYTYYGDVFEVDPNTGVAWTKTGLEAALLRLEKSL